MITFLLLVAGIASILGLLAGLAFYEIDRRLFGRSQRRLTFAIVTGMLVFYVSIVPVFQWATSAITTTVLSASPDVADDVMAFLKMPPGTATDFSYRWSLEGTRFVSDFLMTEEHFLA